MTLFAALIGCVLAVVVAVWTGRLASFVKAGEIHALMSASGEGLAGYVARAEKPFLFWLVVILHASVLAVLSIAYLLWLFGTV